MRSRRLEAFAASLSFAALAALAWPAVALAVGPWIGVPRAFALHLAVCGALYLARLGRARLSAIRRRPLRALAIEACLALLGLALARAVGGPGLVGGALSLWAFGLVESAWFLGGGRAGPRHPAPDPFDEALRRAREVLDGPALRERAP